MSRRTQQSQCESINSWTLAACGRCMSSPGDQQRKFTNANGEVVFTNFTIQKRDGQKTKFPLVKNINFLHIFKYSTCIGVIC